MQLRDGYCNVKLADVPYLLPFGQAIPDHAAGLRLNSTSARLWDALRQGYDRGELLSLLAAEYGAEEEDMPALQEDLDGFLAKLSDNRALLGDVPPCPVPYPEHYCQIGPLRLLLKAPDILWRRYFSEFACDMPNAQDKSAVAQQILFFLEPPSPRPCGRILTRSAELLIAETDTHYLFFPMGGGPLTEMHVSKDGSEAALYCRAPLADADMEKLFHAIRFAFLIAAARQGLYAVHSASLLYRGRAWLFSGHSGAGKSTHTGLWHEAFGTPLLNGDLNLVGMEDGIPQCYGLPWCGTSGIRTSANYPLGGIVFLKQYGENKIVHPTPDQKILYLLQRMISPAWTEEQLTQNIRFCEKLCPLVPMFRLYCTRDIQAAQLIKSAVDDCPGLQT